MFVPILKAKAQYLHAEGVAAAIYAASKQDNVDEELLKLLFKQADERSFGDEVCYVRSDRWSVDTFKDARGYHAFESTFKPQFADLYYRNFVNLCDMHVGLTALNKKSLSKDLHDSIDCFLARFDKAHPELASHLEAYELVHSHDSQMPSLE